MATNIHTIIVLVYPILVMTIHVGITTQPLSADDYLQSFTGSDKKSVEKKVRMIMLTDTLLHGL